MRPSRVSALVLVATGFLLPACGDRAWSDEIPIPVQLCDAAVPADQLPRSGDVTVLFVWISDYGLPESEQKLPAFAYSLHDSIAAYYDAMSNGALHIIPRLALRRPIGWATAGCWAPGRRRAGSGARTRRT